MKPGNSTDLRVQVKQAKKVAKQIERLGVLGQDGKKYKLSYDGPQVVPKEANGAAPPLNGPGPLDRSLNLFVSRNSNLQSFQRRSEDCPASRFQTQSLCMAVQQ